MTQVAGWVISHGQRHEHGDDRIIEDWHLEDNLTFQVQIGVVSS